MDKQDDTKHAAELRQSDSSKLLDGGLDWQKIRFEFPKAFSLFKLRLGLVEVSFQYDLFKAGGPSILLVAVEPGNFFAFETRALFDFFDMEEIFIQIGPSSAFNWIYYIWAWNNFDNFDSQGPIHPTRKEAEIIAFTRAFEILNKRIVSE